MKGNNLGELRNVKSYLNEIKYFYMNSSGIIKINDNIVTSMITSTVHLDITNNGMEYLPQSIIHFTNATKLYISNNPYKCNCDMMWMRDWLVEATNVMDKELLICASGKKKGDTHIQM